MIDLNNLEKYRENNRIEAKTALGGLPHSVWETYAAFANTLGGLILLGVEEAGDKTLRPVDLPEPEKLVKEFWDTINNPNKVSINLLTDKNVRIETSGGARIVVVEVPPARRFFKPVYVNGNPVSGTYRRNGEGDYHCTEEELRAMYRDADTKTQDMLVLENMDTSVFCAESLRAYRQCMKISRPNHVWETLDDESFLIRIGAMGIGSDGRFHPTSAGLLMFGYEYEILREYPQYFLDFREEHDGTHRWTDRFISSSGDWSGNVFDFYFRVYNKLQLGLKVPFEMKGGFRVDDTPIHKALREALANCLINADYYGRRGLVIVKKQNIITMANPGNFRMELAEAKSGGVSDPRNGVMMKMFTLIDIGERAGSGIPGILYAWKQQGWSEPTVTQNFAPDRVTLSLPLSPPLTYICDNKPVPMIRDNENPEIKPHNKKSAINFSYNKKTTKKSHGSDKHATKIGDNAKPVKKPDNNEKSAINVGDTSKSIEKSHGGAKHMITIGDIGKSVINPGNNKKSAINVGDTPKSIGKSNGGDKHMIKIGDIGISVINADNNEKSAINLVDSEKSAIQRKKRRLIVAYLTDRPAAKSSEIAEFADLKTSRVRDYLTDLINENIVVAEGGNRNRTYRLKDEKK